MRLAARGSRHIGDEVEQIEDEAERRQVQRQARGVIARTALASSLLTLAAFLLPASG